MHLMDQHDFRALLHGLADAFLSDPYGGGQIAAQAHRHANLATYRRTPSWADPSSLLAKVKTLPDRHDLIDVIDQCESRLDWTSWEGEGLARETSNRLFTTELLGPDGHIPADNLRVGLLASEPWTDYPLSSHSGEETYLVLAGTAEWIIEGVDYVKHAPGAFIHHPAWVKHGRRTLSEPFLGAWHWSGDLDLSTFAVATP